MSIKKEEDTPIPLEEFYSENLKRFTGFANLYDQQRAQAPKELPRILLQLAGCKPLTRAKRVVDIGCGTGISSFLWDGFADEVVGVDPNPEMLEQARSQLTPSGDISPSSHLYSCSSKLTRFRFVIGFSSETKVKEEADIVTCSQSFHWMEPQSTLKEIHSILRTGGVFAVYDHDWPPIITSEIEAEYLKWKDHCKKEDGNLRRWPKSEHLEQIKKSNLFKFTKEIFLHVETSGDVERVKGLLLSMGSVQDHIEIKDGGLRCWPKSEHLEQIKKSNLFKFTKEIFLHAETSGDVERLKGLLLSMGSVQDHIKKGKTLEELGVTALFDAVERASPSAIWLFQYRIRLGIK